MDHNYATARATRRATFSVLLSKKLKHDEAKKERDRRRQKTRINIGAAFRRWKLLKTVKRLHNDEEVARFLLDSYLGANPSELIPELSSMGRNSSSKTRTDSFGEGRKLFRPEESVSNRQPFVVGLSTGFVLRTGAVSSAHHAASVQSFENGTDRRIRDVACQSNQRQDNWTMTTGDHASRENKGQNGVITDSRQTGLLKRADTSSSIIADDGRYLVDLESSSQHIVDEECIIQLFRNCLECNKKCTVRKRVRGLQLVVYQACYFCHCRCKWSSQPDAEDVQTHREDAAVEETTQSDVAQAGT